MQNFFPYFMDCISVFEIYLLQFSRCQIKKATSDRKVLCIHILSVIKFCSLKKNCLVHASPIRVMLLTLALLKVYFTKEFGVTQSPSLLAWFALSEAHLRVTAAQLYPTLRQNTSLCDTKDKINFPRTFPRRYSVLYFEQITF